MADDFEKQRAQEKAEQQALIALPKNYAKYNEVISDPRVQEVAKDYIAGSRRFAEFDAALQKKYAKSPRVNGVSDGVSRYLDIVDNKGELTNPRQYIEVSPADAEMRHHLRNHLYANIEKIIKPVTIERGVTDTKLQEAIYAVYQEKVWSQAEAAEKAVYQPAKAPAGQPRIEMPATPNLKTPPVRQDKGPQRG